MAPVGGGSGGAWAGAAGVGVASAWRRGAVGRGVARGADSGDGATTLISGSTVWANAQEGTIDSPTAIGSVTTKCTRRPSNLPRMSRCLTTPHHATSPTYSHDRFPVVCRGIKFQIQRELLAMWSRLSCASDLQHRRCGLLRGFLRYIVTDDRDESVLVGAGEEVGLRCRISRPGDTVAFAVQHDGRHRDRWPLGELTLDDVIGRIALRIAEAMAVGVNNYVDEIRIIEGCC